MADSTRLFRLYSNVKFGFGGGVAVWFYRGVRSAPSNYLLTKGNRDPRPALHIAPVVGSALWQTYESNPFVLSERNLCHI